MKRGSNLHATAAVVALFVASFAGSAQAAVVTGLTNTGSAGWTWGLTEATSTGGGSSPAVAYFNGNYAPNTAASQWISTDANGGTTFTDVFFSLAVNSVGSTTVTGIWGVDNISSIFINGVATGQTLGPYGVATFETHLNHTFRLKLPDGT